MCTFRMFYRNTVPYEGDPHYGISASGLDMESVLKDGYEGNFKQVLHENYKTFDDLVHAINHDGWDLPCGVSVAITGAPTLWRIRGEDGAQLGIAETPQLALMRARASWRLLVNKREMFADFVNEAMKNMSPMDIVRCTVEIDNRYTTYSMVSPVVRQCAVWLAVKMVDAGLDSMKVGRFFLERERLIPKEDDERRWTTSEY